MIQRLAVECPAPAREQSRTNRAGIHPVVSGAVRATAIFLRVKMDETVIEQGWVDHGKGLEKGRRALLHDDHLRDRTEDEAGFNDIYDNDHIPTIMRLDGVTEVIQFRDPAPNERGYLVYSAIYFMTKENLHLTPEWEELSDTGRWMPVIRPKAACVAARRTGSGGGAVHQNVAG
jgi:hypothetical protein